MSKRNWIVFSLVLCISLFYGTNQQAYTAETKEYEFVPRCEEVDEEMEEKLESILDILQAEDYDRLTDRVNQLLTTPEWLEDEKNVLEVAICLEKKSEDRHPTGLINGYHSLLVYGQELKEEEDVQFEEITFTPIEKIMYVQVEGVLQDSKEKVTIDHYYSLHAGGTYNTRKLHVMEEELKDMERNSSWMLSITSGLSSSAFAFLQNPIEKFMAIVDSVFTERAEEEQELFEKKAAVDASLFNMRFALIKGEKSKWEQVNMVEYYPSKSTYLMLERAAHVHAELPDYWYPKEEVEQGDWNGIVAYYAKHRPDMLEYDTELSEYIISDGFYNSKNFEEMIDRVKDEHEGE